MSDSCFVESGGRISQEYGCVGVFPSEGGGENPSRFLLIIFKDVNPSVNVSNFGVNLLPVFVKFNLKLYLFLLVNVKDISLDFFFSL